MFLFRQRPLSSSAIVGVLDLRVSTVTMVDAHAWDF